MRILIVDDDLSSATTIARGLKYEGYTTEVATSGREGLVSFRKHHPDLVILDVMMPGVDGYAVLQEIRAADSKVPVLFLTAKDAPDDQITGFDLGADDYVVKPFVFGILLARIKALLRRQEIEIQAETVLRYSDLMLDQDTRRGHRADREFDLTTTEYELLCLFLTNSEKVLTRALIMDRIWGYDFEGNHNVLEVYVRYLRSKTEAGGELRLIHTVRGAGYVLRDRE